MAEANTSFAVYYFLAIFAGYSYYKYTKGGQLGFWPNVIFFLSLIIGEFMINLGMSKDICGFPQPKSAAIATIIPWLLVLGLIKSALILFPGWVLPFENTFGFMVVSAITDIKEVFNNILTPQFDIKSYNNGGDGDGQEGGGDGDLSSGWCAGGGRDGFWNGDDSARRKNLRTWECLGGGGEASSLWHGGNRFTPWAERNRGDCG